MQREPSFRVENHVNGAPPTAPRIAIEPLTSAECLDVAATAYREIRAFLSRNSFLTSGVSAFGWCDRRTLKDGKLMFSLKKFHHGVDAAKLARRGWEACSQRLRQFYPSSMDMKHYTVQQVDENNTVLYRVMVSPDRRFATKALMLVSHFHTETGGAMIIRSLDPSRVRTHKPEVTTKRKRGRRGETRSSEEDEQSSTAISSLTSEQWVNVFTWCVGARSELESELSAKLTVSMALGQDPVRPRGQQGRALYDGLWRHRAAQHGRELGRLDDGGAADRAAPRERPRCAALHCRAQLVHYETSVRARPMANPHVMNLLSFSC